MRTKSNHRNAVVVMDYMMRNPRCEVHLLKPREWRPESFLVRNELHPHHILGSWNGAKRVDCTANLLSVCAECHGIIHDRYPNPGRVVCLYRKLEKQELDWRVLSDILGMQLPGALEKDSFIEACGKWPCVERMRAELLEGT